MLLLLQQPQPNEHSDEILAVYHINVHVIYEKGWFIKYLINTGLFGLTR